MRPTGLLDPEIEVRPAGNQVEDLLSEINSSVKRGERVLVTTLTKRMSEDLTEFFLESGVRVRYLHSDIETVERVEIISKHVLMLVPGLRHLLPGFTGRSPFIWVS